MSFFKYTHTNLTNFDGQVTAPGAEISGLHVWQFLFMCSEHHNLTQLVFVKSQWSVKFVACIEKMSQIQSTSFEIKRVDVNISQTSYF